MKWFDREFLNRIIRISGIALVVYLIFRYLFPLVIPFVFSMLLAECLHPAAKYTHKKFHVPYKIGAVVLVLAVSVGICTIAGVIMYFLLQQIKLLCSNMPFIQNELCDVMEKACKCCDKWLGMGSGKVYGLVQYGTDYLNNNWNSKVLPIMTYKALDICMWVVSAVFIFTFFLIGTWLIMDEYEVISKEWHNSYVISRLRPVANKLRTTIGAYFKAQGIIICIVAIICTVGLFIIGNPYALLIGIVIAVLDSLPIIGSGAILVPWALIYVFQDKLGSAAIIASIYLISLIVREVLEPKIMGQQTGLRPIYTFISFYIGIKLFGLIGVILGPIAFVIIQTIYLMTICPNEQSP